MDAARTILSQTPVDADKLREALDADRGTGTWFSDFAPRPTLRAVLLHGEQWEWLASLDDGVLRAHRRGMWDCNELDSEAAASWEISRREAGVDEDTVRAWLGITKRGNR